MKKLIALTLLCLPLVCQGGGIKGGKKVKKPVVDQSAVTRTVMAQARLPLAKSLRSMVTTAMENTAAYYRGKRVYYGRRPYFWNSAQKVLQSKRPTQNRIEAWARLNSSMERWKKHPTEAPRIVRHDLPAILFSRSGEELFGPAFLMKGEKRGMIVTAVPTKVSLEIIKGASEETIKPFSFATIGMEPLWYLDDAASHGGLRILEEDPIPFHGVNLEGPIDNIVERAFSSVELVNYASDVESTLFSTKMEDGHETHIPTQNILVKTSNGRVYILPQGVGRLNYGYFERNAVTMSGLIEYAEFQKSVLEDAFQQSIEGK